jgi:hypothetical protein
MTATPVSATPDDRAWTGLGGDGTGPFIARMVLLMAAMLAAPAVLSMVDLPLEVHRYIIPIGVALLVAGTYLRWPAEALFALSLYVMFYETTAWYLGNPVKRIDEYSILFLAPIALWRGLPSWRAWISWPRDLAIGLAMLMGVASSLAAGVPIAIWFPALLLLAKAIIFFYIVLLSPIRAEDATAGLWVVIGAGLVVASLGFIEMLNPGAFQQFLGMNGYVRIRGENVVVKSLFVHPALFGYFTAFVALLLLARYLVTRRLRWLLLSVFVATGPFLSARRRAILALAAGVGAGLVASFRIFADRRILIRTWVPALAGYFALTVLFLTLLTGLYDLTLRTYLEPSGAGPTPSPVIGEVPPGEGENRRARFALYAGSVEVAVDNAPLGGGLGRYGSWMSREHYSPLYYEYDLSDVRGLKPESPIAITDTFWPQILGELGIIGFAGYVVFTAALGWMLWREAGRKDGPELLILRLAAGMVFAQALVESAASAMYHSPSRVYLYYLMIGVVASLAWRRRADSAR